MYKTIDFNPNYKINEYGEIISLPRNGNGYKEVIMAQHLDKYGYPIVSLRQNHKKHTYKVHRLVAKYFVPNPNNLPQVNHKDGNKQNNYYKNLEWCTPKENINHAIKLGLTPDITNRQPVAQYDLNNNLIKVFRSLKEAEKQTGICWTGISAVIRGKRKTAGGFIWKKFND